MKKHIALVFLLIAGLIISPGISNKANAQSWVPVGPGDYNQPSIDQAQNTATAFNSVGTPYVVFTGTQVDGRVTVRKFNGTFWENVGTPKFSTGTNAYTTIAISPNDTPYVAYQDGGNQAKATVKKFNGTSWETVGIAGFSTGKANTTSIAISPDGTPYVVYSDVANNYKATVMKFDGTNWVTVGGVSFTDGGADGTDIAINSSGDLYVVYTDRLNGNKPTVKKFNGTGWVTVGSPGFSGGMAYCTSIALNSAGTPYVAFSYPGNNYKAVVMKFNGSDWEVVGNNGISSAESDYINIAISADGTPYIAYLDWASGYKITVKKFNGTSWVTLGSEGFSTGSVKYTSIAINPGGTPYVVYCDEANSSYLATMKKYNGVSWEIVGSAGISTFEAKFTSLALNPNDIPYLACLDGGYLAVKKFINNSWKTVGSDSLTVSGIENISIVMSPDGTPYVAYNYNLFTSNPPIFVKKFNGTTWDILGNKNTPLGQGIYPSLAFSPDGTPYVAFRDDNNGRKISVVKFNGSNWVTVGPAGFSAGQADNSRLAINASGTPYVYYWDRVNNDKVTVMKFNGTNWDPVGKVGLSPALALNGNIVFNSNGTPYIVFSDNTNNLKATVMKFNGTNWEAVGTTCFSPGQAYCPMIALDQTGNPYIVFGDCSKNYQATVMKFNGTNWENLGNSNFTAQRVGYPCIALTADGTPYVAFSNGGAWCYKYEANKIKLTWNGSTNNDWNTPTNWTPITLPASSTDVTIPITIGPNFAPVVNQASGSPAVCNNLDIASGAQLTIAPGKALTINGTLTNSSAGGILIQSDVSGTGSLIAGTATGTGTTVKQQYMTASGWHLLSSPLSGQTITAFLQSNNSLTTNGLARGMMDFNPTNDTWNPQFTNSQSGILGQGNGYAMLSTADGNITCTGSLRTGLQTVTGLTAGKWNCVANPFTSTIGINSVDITTNNFLSANASKLDPNYSAVYLLDKSNSIYGITGPYTVISKVPSQFDVQQGQGFFVKMNSTATSVSFDPEMQYHNGTLALKSSFIPWPTIKLKASFNTLQSSTLIAFNNAMTKGLDPSYDAGLLKAGADLLIYSKFETDNGIPYAIQALPDNDYANLVIPIGVDFKTGGEVTFSSESFNLPLDCKVFLEDRQAHINTDLSLGVYKVILPANSTVSNRFFLHTAATSVGLPEELPKVIYSAFANKNIDIRLNGAVSNKATATLYDIHGRIVLVKKLINGDHNIIPLPVIKSGIYMLSVDDNGIMKGFKILIRE